MNRRDIINFLKLISHHPQVTHLQQHYHNNTLVFKTFPAPTRGAALSYRRIISLVRVPSLCFSIIMINAFFYGEHRISLKLLSTHADPLTPIHSRRSTHADPLTPIHSRRSTHADPLTPIHSRRSTHADPLTPIHSRRSTHADPLTPIHSRRSTHADPLTPIHSRRSTHADPLTPIHSRRSTHANPLTPIHSRRSTHHTRHFRPLRCYKRIHRRDLQRFSKRSQNR